MKTTYLIYRETNSGEKELAIATREEWNSILAINRTLPREQRRFFIESRIREGNTWDCMFIETSRDEYNTWHSQEAKRSRNLRDAKEYQFLSLDYGCSFDDDVGFAETVAESTNFEEEVASDMFMHDLRSALAAWRDWTNELLDYYLAGKRVEATKIMSEKYGLSEKTVQRYKNRLDEFVKNFLKNY